MIKTFPLLILLAPILLSSCKKRVSERNLTGTKWQLMSIIDQDGVNIWSYPARRKCELDNISAFEKNNVFRVSDVGEVCSPGSGYTTRWEIYNGKLVFGAMDQYLVDKFTKNELIIRQGYKYKTYQRVW